MESLLLPSSSSSPCPTPQLPAVVSSPCAASPTPVSQPLFDPNPRTKKKKRSKTTVVGVNVDDPGGHGGGSSVKVRTVTRKPDPNAPKITPPCTECGKRFWSWKALFGHMRCHPERQWRGINPPPSIRSSAMQPPGGREEAESFPRAGAVVAVMTAEDHEVAECLLKLAACPVLADDRGAAGIIGQTAEGWCESLGTWQKFECSSCKKVFGSHQALGGHRASHKNVKGCFAMARGGNGSEEAFLGSFRTDAYSEGGATTTPRGRGQLCSLDLNRPAPRDESDSSSSSSASRRVGSTLDLRLCL